MIVKRNTPDVFMAEEIPWFMAGVLVIVMFCCVAPGLAMVFDGLWQGAVLALAGGGMSFVAICVFVERLQVILDRRTGQITLRRRTVLTYAQQILPLNALIRAELQSTTSSQDGSSRNLTRPALVLKDSRHETAHPITQVYSSGANAAVIVSVINSWMAQGR